MEKMDELNLAITELKNVSVAINRVADALESLFSSIDSASEAQPRPEKIAEDLPTLEAVRAVLAEKSRNGHTAAIKALLQKYGANKLSAIEPSKYPALLADVEELGNA